ncbi:MAG: mechanosensitive ion channel [Gemmatimonadetes bacterium]|nr:mechanosensitive ion channel [Gemmatimonadota bacterium]
MEKLLRTHPEVSQKSTMLVRFNEISENSLDIMVYYFTATTVWADYLRIREDVNLKIMEIVESLGLEIAFPTRTIHVSPDSEDLDTGD